MNFSDHRDQCNSQLQTLCMEFAKSLTISILFSFWRTEKKSSQRSKWVDLYIKSFENRLELEPILGDEPQS